MATPNPDYRDSRSTHSQTFKKFKREDGSARNLDDTDESLPELEPAPEILDDTYEEKIKEAYLAKLGLAPRQTEEDDADLRMKEEYALEGIRQLHMKDVDLHEEYEKKWTAPKAIPSLDVEGMNPACPDVLDPGNNEDKEDEPPAASSPWREIPKTRREGAGLIRSPPKHSIWNPVPIIQAIKPIPALGTPSGIPGDFAANLSSFNWTDPSKTPTRRCLCHSSTKPGSKSQ